MGEATPLANAASKQGTPILAKSKPALAKVSLNIVALRAATVAL
jgi:hypothetical protein